ncbi:hypothetical protein BMF94_4538 [Rhodotorula taiwanensis]|uniref:TLC domain-containing protein n=1 Tax=Rhodotorula taiwanensis TaxID=741276 RepID=A0A2S5B7G4_9BASI|nr:hypothetical protein BMF94_4538 [Rhodotorula taiwanensis]
MSWIESRALEPYPALVALARPLGDRLGFTALPQVAHLAVSSCIVSFGLQKLSAAVSPRVFGKYYPTNRVKKDDWDLHMVCPFPASRAKHSTTALLTVGRTYTQVGWAYAFVAAPIAIYLLRHPSPALTADPLYGVALPEQRLSAIAIGYFIWDAFVTARHIGTQGIGFFLHGAVCLTAFLFTLRPFVLWCGPSFLVFLNAHWLFDKLHMTGSIGQMVNGLFLVLSYIVVRLGFGTFNSYKLIKLLVPSASNSSLNALRVREVGAIRWMYLALNIMANSLNFYWFRLMLLALKKRFVPSPNSRQAEKTRGKPIPVDGKIQNQDQRVKGE